MVDDKNKPMSREERAELISDEAMKPIKKVDPSRCIDDRLSDENLDYDDLPELVVKPEQASGPQMLGGAYSIFDIALETVPDDIEPDFDQVFDLTKKAHSDAGYVMGIHMGTLHGQLNKDEVKDLLEKAIQGEEVELPDCGYNGMVHSSENPLGLSQRSVEFHGKYPNRAAMFIQRGVKVAVLGGGHAQKENALAIMNNQEGMTLDSQKAHRLGQPAYNHDQKPFEEILTALADNADEIDPRWGNNIREKGKERYMELYGIVGKELAGMTPVAN